MARKLTLRILDGPDKGKAFNDRSLPVAIGREPGNDILLNDERISRYHLKFVESDGRIFLSDLGSTNGTLLNGESIVAGEIHVGDVVALGRTVLIVGSRQEIRNRLEHLGELNPVGSVERHLLDEDEWDTAPESLKEEIAAMGNFPGNPLLRLHRLAPPPLPENLEIDQFARLSDIFLYYQLRLRTLVEAGAQQVKKVQGGGSSNQIVFELKDWQNLLDVYARTAEYLKKMNDF